MTPEDINLAREWLASIESVGRDTLDPLIQRIVDTIEEALEIAMEHILEGKKIDDQIQK